jgi:peptide/nickel transport system permease protein
MTMTTSTEVAGPIAVAEVGETRFRVPKPGVVFSLLWLVGILFLAVFARYLPFMRTETQVVQGAGPYTYGPGSDFWFGSDQLGRDVFARCIYGARISLLIAGTSILVGFVIGGTLGMLAGYFKGFADRTVSIVAESLLAFPAIVIATMIIGRIDVLRESEITVAGVGFGWMSRTWSIIFVFSLLSIAPVARIVRAQTLSLSQREYVMAARGLGARTPRILLREVIPNVVPALISVLFTGIAILLAAESGLAFLGYSVEGASWGGMIAQDRTRIETAWWATIFPCVMLFFTVLAFNLLGNHIARRFDIREAAL